MSCEIFTYSGRFILRVLRRKNTCHQIGKINRILVIADVPQKAHLDCHQFDYNCESVANSFAA